MANTVKKDSNAQGGESWFVYQDGEVLGSYGWSYRASNNGGAFARNHRASNVNIIVDTRQSNGSGELFEVVAGQANSYAKAAKIGRAYLRAHKASFMWRFETAVKEAA